MADRSFGELVVKDVDQLFLLVAFLLVYIGLWGLCVRMERLEEIVRCMKSKANMNIPNTGISETHKFEKQKGK
jgi:hypothetical protein